MIKFHFFGKENQLNKTLTNYSDLKVGLEERGFSHKDLPIFVNQVHGNEVLIIDNQSKIPPRDPLKNFDAIITNLKNLPIAVFTADCAPIFLFDEENEVVGVVHAGWQGAFKDVMSNAIDEMVKIGAKLINIKSIIGPMIRQESYEVDENFYEKFLNKNPANKKFFIPSSNDNHYLFDLPSYVRNKLKNAGIRDIKDDGIDTYRNSEEFCSYRKNTHLGIKDDENRNVSVIQIC